MKLFWSVFFKILYFPCFLIRLAIVGWILFPLAWCVFASLFAITCDIFIFYHDLFLIWRVLLVIGLFFIASLVLFLLFFLAVIISPEVFDTSYKEIFEFVKERNRKCLKR
ncbi:TPA: hypothetical protein ACF1UY_001766 [Enterococcus hirae]